MAPAQNINISDYEAEYRKMGFKNGSISCSGLQESGIVGTRSLRRSAGIPRQIMPVKGQGILQKKDAPVTRLPSFPTVPCEISAFLTIESSP